jgi:hypothetical protein
MLKKQRAGTIRGTRADKMFQKRRDIQETQVGEVLRELADDWLSKAYPASVIGGNFSQLEEHVLYHRYHSSTATLRTI